MSGTRPTAKRRPKAPKQSESPEVGSANSSVAVQDGAQPQSAVVDAYPHNPLLLDSARHHWLAGRWRELDTLDDQTLTHHPDRAKLAAVVSAAVLQAGDVTAARRYARKAKDWGVDRKFLAHLMLATARDTLGSASFFAGKEQEAARHFEKAFPLARQVSEERRLARERLSQVAADLKQANQVQSTLRKHGGRAVTAVQSAGMSALVRRCFDATDLHAEADHIVQGLLSSAEDKTRFLMLVGDAFLGRADAMTALHYFRGASKFAIDEQCPPALRTEVSRRLVAAGSAETALELLLEQTVVGHLEHAEEPALGQTARQTFQRLRASAQAHQEHGHDLLIAWLERSMSELKAKAAGRKLNVIEIGSTREDVPGQGSTRKIAEFCKRHNLRFITVDMDPHNTRMAERTCSSVGLDFAAVNAKGEDFLRSTQESLDFVFLDAYDFDHGMHSAIRQSRYEKFLGARIDDRACHQMHLDCAQSVSLKLWAHGAVCVDDTWLEEGNWTAKGTLAMPFLLETGFQVVEARNRAALLVRAA